jgi:hypothetical protein
MFEHDFFSNYELVSAALVPIILAIVQAFKLTEWVKDKYVPLLSILVGIGVSFLVNDFLENDLQNNILTGVMLGLSASGLYSTLKHTQYAIMEARRAKKSDKIKY